MTDEQLIKYLKGDSNSEEKINIECWLSESVDNEIYLSELESRYEEDRFASRMLLYDVDAAYKKVDRRLWMLDVKNKAYQLRRFAAILVVAIVSGVLYLTLFDQSENLITIESNQGSNISYILPDGSKVVLNKHSRIVFPKTFSENERRVRLEGEAYFEVQKDTKKPFYVQTGDSMEVKVLGTKFNVQAYPGDSILETSLYEGAISIKEKMNDSNFRLLSPSEKYIINKKVRASVMGRTSKYNTADWMFDRQVFDDTALPEVMRVLSHQFDVNVVMVGDLLPSYVFTGTFENKTLHQILKYIQISSNINFKIEKQKNGKDIVTISSTV